MLSSCYINHRMSKDYVQYKNIYKNYFIGKCIFEYNNLKPNTKEYVPPKKLVLYGMKCDESLDGTDEDIDRMLNLIEKIRPILDKRVYVSTETMGSLKTMFPQTDCITNECLILYDSKELDKIASDYAIKRIKEEMKNKK